MSDTNINPAFSVVDDATDENEHTPPPLWKQLLGAVVGAGLALAIYGLYQVVAPPVTALLISAPQEKHEDKPQHAVGVSAAHREKRSAGTQN